MLTADIEKSTLYAEKIIKLKMTLFLFQKYIFFPICSQQHWVFLVVCNIDKAIEQLIKGNTRQKVKRREKFGKNIAVLESEIRKAKLNLERKTKLIEKTKQRIQETAAKKEVIKPEVEQEAEQSKDIKDELTTEKEETETETTTEEQKADQFFTNPDNDNVTVSNF